MYLLIFHCIQIEFVMNLLYACAWQRVAQLVPIAVLGRVPAHSILRIDYFTGVSIIL